MNDLTLITCSYNTPDITLTMLKSWVSVHGVGHQRLILSDNSTDNNTSDLLKLYNVPHLSNFGKTHGEGVDILIESCKTKYALLVDTDVIFLKNHSDIFEKFKDMNITIMGKVEGDRGGKHIHNRVNPWHCFINVEDVKSHNIKFHDEKRMRDSFKTSCIYDIGSTFLEDIKRENLKIGDVDLAGIYYNHLEGMSWYKNKYDPTKEDTGIDFGGTHNNYGYVQAYNSKHLKFEKIESIFENVNLYDKFIY